MLVKKVKTFARTIRSRLLFPKIGGDYLYLTLGKVFRAPSQRQIAIVRQHCKENWKSDEYEIVEMILKDSKTDSPVIFDVGANIGYTAIAYSELLKGTNGRCVSFEPAAANWFYFSTNTRNRSNITLLTFGLGEKSKPIKLGMPIYVKEVGKDEENTGFLSAKLKVNDSAAIYAAASFSLDHVAEGILGDNDVIALIKIDVEGLESDVVSGALETIERHQPTIQMEYNPRTSSNDEVEKIFSSLRAMGYTIYSNRVFKYGTQSELYFVHQSKTSLRTLIESKSNLTLLSSFT